MAVDLATGSTLSDRYRIERPLGTGGMATVYLAEDRKHGRKVAVKVLGPDVAATVGMDRFEREIELAAGLSHPHILPIHDSGETDGLLYYVMPHVDGESLRGRLDREKQLPVDEAVRIARQVADALAYAHQRDVVHRDVKPENILLEGRHALLSDFGIARAIGTTDAERLTRTGLAVGTPTYMSPEQGAGDGPGDGRADIYALGCVLHEMLAGQPPLMGRTAQATVARRLTESPPPLRHLRETVPPELERLVQKTLARTPADRYATALGLARALEGVEARLEAGASMLEARGGAESTSAKEAEEESKPAATSRTPPPLAAAARKVPSRGWAWLGGAATAVAALVVGLLVFSPSEAEEDSARAAGEGPVSSATAMTLWSADSDARPPATRIAVLPFEDLTSDGRLEHLSAGFTRALIQELSAVEALDVVSYNGVKAFAAGETGLDSIARVVRAGTLVGATVEESEGRLRVQVELIDPASGTNLATTRVERPRAELFGLQDEVVREVAHFLRRSLRTEVALHQRRAATGSVQAWEAVQRAEGLREEFLPLWTGGNREAALRRLSEADALLARAERLDPAWVEPIVLRGWLAETRARLSSGPGDFDEESGGEALAHAERALRLEPESPAGLELRGTVLFRLWQQSDAPEEEQGTLEAAERDLREAVSAEPSRARAWATLSELLHVGRGSINQAALAAERAYREDAFLENSVEIIRRLANIAIERERYEEAIRWHREGHARFPEKVDFVATELMLLTFVGETREDAERAWELRQAVGELSPPDWRDHYLASADMQVAAILARAGLTDSARAVIRRTREQAPEEVRRWASYEEAYAHLTLGERDEALRQLRIYVEEEPARRDYLAEDRWFAPLREDPRFQELVGATR